MVLVDATRRWLVNKSITFNAIAAAVYRGTDDDDDGYIATGPYIMMDD